jgi:hypothetical protein
LFFGCWIHGRHKTVLTNASPIISKGVSPVAKGNEDPKKNLLVVVVVFPLLCPEKKKLLGPALLLLQFLLLVPRFLPSIPIAQKLPDGTVKNYYRLKIHNNSTNSTLIRSTIQEALISPYNTPFDDKCEMLLAFLSAEENILLSNIDKPQKSGYLSFVGLDKDDEAYLLEAVVDQ